MLSINSANYIKEGMDILFKDNAKVHVETADYMVMFKPEQKQEFRKKVAEKAKEAKWRMMEKTPYSHHMLMEVIKKE